MAQFINYPKTFHITGSKECDVGLCPKFLQNTALELKNLVIEEKMDGMGVGIFFEDSKPYVQFRGQIFDTLNHPSHLSGLFEWLEIHLEEIYLIILEDYVLFGEWLEFKHCVFYNALPSYFIEYDIFHKASQQFLDTPTRQKMLGGSFLTSAFVHSSTPLNIKALVDLLSSKTAFGKSLDIQTDFEKLCIHHKSKELLKKQTLLDIYPEGFYIKQELGGIVVGRYKFIRKSFLTTILNSMHWNATYKVRNQLASV